MKARAAVLALGIGSSLAPLAWAAESYPSKPIRLVVPYAPGGGTDIIARLIGQALGERWGQTVVVDNRTGAGGIIGVSLVAKSNPDGYTMLLASNGP
ncbi:MAG: tripartite tricarboxylate transporter substrate binding protein, partial [Betaproteobacteria bacterium]|nr:tripartite tricarboxylate transporter substrate binding protein [Betaproteobacteria bacterium]